MTSRSVLVLAKAMAPWIVLGAVASVALANGSPLVFLLVPVVLVAVFLAWQLDPGFEVSGALIGLALLPVLLIDRPVACPAEIECLEPPLIRAPAWPYVLTAAVLIMVGVLLGLVRLRQAVRPDARQAV